MNSSLKSINYIHWIHGDRKNRGDETLLRFGLKEIKSSGKWGYRRFNKLGVGYIVRKHNVGFKKKKEGKKWNIRKITDQL